MKVRLLAGFTNGMNPGDEYEGDDAIRLVQAGFAVPVSGVAVETTAAAPTHERRKGGSRKAKGS